MNSVNKTQILSDAINTINQQTPKATDGKWLEQLTIKVASSIVDWDVSKCQQWTEWEDRKKYLPYFNGVDTGIDAVATRNDGKLIAIQCKARKILPGEEGNSILLGEINSFIVAATAKSEARSDIFSEMWVVTNGVAQISNNLTNTAATHRLKIINLSHDIIKESESHDSELESKKCTHCESQEGGEDAMQTKNCMQNEAVNNAVRILKEHVETNSNGIPKGEARGRIILPCGTGKTRISMRIIEEMSPLGDIAIVLCPSIALVAQIRREYLKYKKHDNMRTLSVCSDATAGNNNITEDKIASGDDPTIDNSNAKQNEIKGDVTTDVCEIVSWMKTANKKSLNVIFGTYQSSYKIGESLIESGIKASVLIADEAHRTSGLVKGRQKDLLINADLKSEGKLGKEMRIKNFGVCHDNNKFPVKYRIYQTATPKIYKVDSNKKATKNTDYYVRSMDDVDTFGIELYRRSYQDAVKNEWLADYRIIAIGVRDEQAYDVVNKIAKKMDSKSKTSAYTYLKGLTLAMSLSGAAQQITYQGKEKEKHGIAIKSCIAFLNTVDASKNMAKVLQSDEVKGWLKDWWKKQGFTKDINTSYTIKHLDAKSNVLRRDEAKKNLIDATDDNPFAVTNVGIFGEGTDAPALSAISFLEPRKSPVDVIQAVGRAMRKSKGKRLGFIICPVVIPQNSDAEIHLSTSEMQDGWQELGQVLLALRAHDSRIEDNISQFLHLYPQMSATDIHVITALATPENPNLVYAECKGDLNEISKKIEDVVLGNRKLDEVCTLLNEFVWKQSYKDDISSKNATDPAHIMTVRKYETGEIEIRISDVVRDNKSKSKSDNLFGKINVKKCKKEASNMIHRKSGQEFNAEVFEAKQKMVKNRKADELLSWLDSNDIGENIKINLLTKSGLCQDKVMRDLNILEDVVKESSRYLKQDKLGSLLDKHLEFENLEKKDRADSCTIASLLLVNAAMLHQRIASRKWLGGIKEMKYIKNETNVINEMYDQWTDIMSRDFVPVIEPALMVISAIKKGKMTFGLEKALTFIASEVQNIAETYANMGADHAGLLFNKVMGDQASDGAFFTRPVAASIAARLTLDVSGENNWRDEQTWMNHKSIDIACGSGTFLTALLADMKRRAKKQGASEKEISKLHKLAVEDVIHGLDINPISLQLAASQLTASNHDVSFKRMRLFQMPYGVYNKNPNLVSAGTLELLGQSDIIPQSKEFFAKDRKSKTVWTDNEQSQVDTKLEGVVNAAKNSRIVIMNPPFTNRKKMGEKFTKDVREKLRERIDYLHDKLVANDKELKDFANKNSIGPLFVALADACANKENGTITMVLPTIALTVVSGLAERKILANRFHIHTIIASHNVGNVNMSQNTNINESIIIMHRNNGISKNTRIINLDKMPIDEEEVNSLYNEISKTTSGDMNNGWGNISECDSKHMLNGDWSQSCFRCNELSNAIHEILNNKTMFSLKSQMLKCHATRDALRKPKFKSCDHSKENSFPILDSKGCEGQKHIKSTFDAFWMGIGENGKTHKTNLLSKEGYLLITSGQNISNSRLTATASNEKYVGRGWLPISNIDADKAKGLAVFLNSTVGRLQFLRIPGMSLNYPTYNPAALKTISVPDLKNDKIYKILKKCWEATQDMEVPQYRDGECKVRQLWDKAVCDALNLDYEYMSKLRNLLHKEPIIRGKSYGEYSG